jgi:signal transduction histidine kinase
MTETLPRAQEKPRINIEGIRLYVRIKWLAIFGLASIIVIEWLSGYLQPLQIIGHSTGYLATGLINLWLNRATRQGKTVNKFVLPVLYVSLLVDILVMFMTVYLSGGMESTWWYMPITIIFVTGYLLDLRTAVLYALISFLIVAGVFSLEIFRLIPHFTIFSQGKALEYWRDSSYVTDYLLGIFLIYFLAALTSGYFNRLLRQNAERVGKSLRESEGARNEVESSRKALLKALDDLEQAKADLEVKVRERTKELETSKIDLEAKIKERTVALEESRKAILHMMKNLKEDIVKLQALDKMKTEFLSMVSHELRTPLTPIKGYISLLTTGKLGALNDMQGKAIEVLARQSEHLHAMIDSILDLSRMELGKRIPLVKQPLSMRTVIEETVEAMKLQAGEKQVNLSAEIQEDLPPVEGDIIKLKRVLSNLIGNALKFVPANGVIRIKAVRNDGFVQVSVADNGIGVSADNLPHLFEKFYQVDSSITRQAGGMGMGLAIVKELVELHGGQIKLESEGLGKGTTATFTLPVPSETKQPEAKQ